MYRASNRRRREKKGQDVKTGPWEDKEKMGSRTAGEARQLDGCRAEHDDSVAKH